MHFLDRFLQNYIGRTPIYDGKLHNRLYTTSYSTSYSTLKKVTSSFFSVVVSNGKIPQLQLITALEKN